MCLQQIVGHMKARQQTLTYTINEGEFIKRAEQGGDG